jgi:hypothetical protein
MFAAVEQTDCGESINEPENSGPLAHTTRIFPPVDAPQSGGMG